LLATIERNFQSGKTIAVVGTIQFNATIHGVVEKLKALGYGVIVPQISPLSKGEILGCTSPRIQVKTEITEGADLILYLGDGRFHLESAMIHNPNLPAYRYDPYSRRLTRESFNHEELYTLRRDAILTARKGKTWGLILGTLGRQGNPNTLQKVEDLCRQRNIQVIRLALSEIFPSKLAQLSDVDAWVQVACPRLSIDWGYAFLKPLLSPYEALVALQDEESSQSSKWMEQSAGEERSYPMDYYAREGLGRVTAPVQ